MIQFAGLLLVYFVSLNNTLSENQFLYFFINSTVPNYNYTISLLGPLAYHFNGSGEKAFIGKVNVSDILFGEYRVYINISGVSYKVFGGTINIVANPKVEVLGCGNVYLFGNESKFNVSVVNVGNTPLNTYIPSYNSSTVYPLYPGNKLIMELSKGIKNVTIYYDFENYTYYRVCSFSYPSTSFTLRLISVNNFKNSTGNYYVFDFLYNGSIEIPVNISGYLYAYGSYLNYKTDILVNRSGNYTLRLPPQLSFSKINMSYTNSSGRVSTFSYGQLESIQQASSPNAIYYVIIFLVVIILLFVLHRLIWKKK
ncbi:MAG: hypothetical protein QXP36_06135 [Conexivisphaerales archaeon]